MDFHNARSFRQRIPLNIETTLTKEENESKKKNNKLIFSIAAQVGERCDTLSTRFPFSSLVNISTTHLFATVKLIGLFVPDHTSSVVG